MDLITCFPGSRQLEDILICFMIYPTNHPGTEVGSIPLVEITCETMELIVANNCFALTIVVFTDQIRCSPVQEQICRRYMSLVIERRIEKSLMRE